MKKKPKKTKQHEYAPSTDDLLEQIATLKKHNAEFAKNDAALRTEIADAKRRIAEIESDYKRTREPLNVVERFAEMVANKIHEYRYRDQFNED